MIEKLQAYKLLTIIVACVINFSDGYAFDQKQCVTLSFGSYGRIAVNSRLIKGGLANALRPSLVVDSIEVNPPPKNNLSDDADIDRMTLNWDDSHHTRPDCRLVLSNTTVGNYYNCFFDLNDKSLATGVLFHTKSSKINVDGFMYKMRDYMENNFLDCDQP